jgi:hypothetical protein
MTEWQPVTTATPIYCHACGMQIAPGTYKIVQGFPYHSGCAVPHFGPNPIERKMTDIVERLERAAKADKFANARQLKLEAADEIKRLRAALE